MMKVCKDCSTAKPADSFQRRQQTKDGLDNYCKPCKKARHAAYLAKYLTDPIKRERYKISQTRWAKQNPERVKASGHETWLRLRDAMLDAYGRSCACCGESHVEFLTLEHVNRDGSLHRKKVGGGANTYRDLRDRGWPKDGYKVLCMNCNWGMRRGGVCPHQQSPNVG